jgi:hypothetical protein
VGTILSGALSWLAVVTIGLAPILARVIGRELRRKALGPPAGNPLAGPEKGEQGQRCDAVPRG